MKILAFDLVWDGLTGWVYWDDDPLTISGQSRDPVVSYGEFKPKAPTKLSGARRQQALCGSLFNNSRDVIATFKCDWIAFEQSDWFQDLTRGKDWKSTYKRERVVQRSLGLAEGAFMLAAAEFDVPIYGIGAREAKQEFGAVRKDSAARLICEEYPRFKIEEVSGEGISSDLLFGSKSDGFFTVVDTYQLLRVPHHVTDAIVIAKVVSARLRRDELGN